MTRPRRRLLIILGLLAIPAVVLLWIAILVRGGGYVTQAQYDRVKIGMELSEVRKILGTEQTDVIAMSIDKSWEAVEGVVGVNFDAYGRVCGKEYLKRPFLLLWCERIYEKLGY